jgi:hypothetical protein
MLAPEADNVKSGKTTNLERSSDPRPDRERLVFPVWRYAVLCLVLMFSVDVCFKFFSKLRVLGQPVSGMILDAMVFAALWAAGVSVFYWVDKKGRGR